MLLVCSLISYYHQRRSGAGKNFTYFGFLDEFASFISPAWVSLHHHKSLEWEATWLVSESGLSSEFNTHGFYGENCCPVAKLGGLCVGVALV